MEDNEERIKDKVNFFVDEKIEVHVNLKDKTFLNGIIEGELKEGVYWIVDRKLGGVYLFLKDIYDIEQIREKKDSWGRGLWNTKSYLDLN